MIKLCRGTLLKNITVAVLVVVFLTGCATIISGTSQEIGIVSRPSGAKVIINGVFRGTTPMAIKLSRKDTHKIRLELEGYKPYEVVLVRRINWWVLGNLIFGGLIGLAVDAISGGIYRLSPDSIDVKLDVAKGDTVLFIKVVEGYDPSWEKIGQLESW